MDANYEMTKSYAQRVHAKRRFQERKGIDLTRKLRRQLVAMIRDEDRSVRLVTRQSRRVSVWDVQVLGERCRVVYDCTRKNIVTVLPDAPNCRL